VHFYAECQAVDAFENLVPYGHFLTPNGFLIKAQPSAVDMYHADETFMQIDGAFGTTGGSEPAYALPAGDMYKSGTDITLMTNHLSAPGSWDVWMTGYLDGACSAHVDHCGTYGKVSYLGGHQYTTNLPISTNPKTQGVRLFLNSLFDSYCASQGGLPNISFSKTAPATSTSSTVTFTIDYANAGPSVALNAVITDPIPAGSTFVSATGGGTFANGKVTWNLGNLGVAESGAVQLTVTLGGYGTYANTAQLAYVVGLNPFTRSSNATSTLYGVDTDGDGVLDAVDDCPNNYDPAQDLSTDPNNCGTCGHSCGMAACVNGMCAIASCPAGQSDCNGVVSDGCEYANTGFATDPNNCGGCGVVCAFPNAQGACMAGACALGGCLPGYVDADKDPTNGCEYACTPTATNDVTCDGVDDDCDGQIDEDYVPTSCGQGACAAMSTCALGVESCTPGTPAIEGPSGSATCSDGIDNDCDGLVDSADSDCNTAACQTAADCDDKNPCTSDDCFGGFCTHSGIDCDAGPSGSGGAGGSGAGGGATTSSSGTGGGTTTSASTGGETTGSTGGTGGSAGTGGNNPGDQGSCACRTAAPDPTPERSLGLLLAMAALAARRRRRILASR
jgi:uncharacterized repeat protein (TIGR01451 family)/MYXO-CTERM domain-containing protein